VCFTLKIIAFLHFSERELGTTHGIVEFKQRELEYPNAEKTQILYKDIFTALLKCVSIEDSVRSGMQK